MLNNSSIALQVPGRMADREAEARARRFAQEAAAVEGRAFWLTGGMRVLRHGGAVLLTRVQHVKVGPGSALKPSPGQP